MAESGDGRVRGAAGWIRPAHGGLPVVAEERFESPLRAHRLVTFLNRALKARGLVFGLALEGDAVRIRIYATDSGNADGAKRKDGEPIGDERDPDDAPAR